MDTLPNREVDRMLAERTGYRFEHVRQHVMYDYWAVFDPTGKPCIRETAYGSKNEWPDYELESTYPEYTTDLNAAISLVAQDVAYFKLSYSPDRLNWRAEFDDLAHTVFADAITPAGAICLAYLDWLAAKR